jgi:hypothetical protein
MGTTNERVLTSKERARVYKGAVTSGALFGAIVGAVLGAGLGVVASSVAVLGEQWRRQRGNVPGYEQWRDQRGDLLARGRRHQ